MVVFYAARPIFGVVQRTQASDQVDRTDYSALGPAQLGIVWQCVRRARKVAKRLDR